MSLKDLLEEGRLEQRATSKREILDLLNVAEGALATPQLSRCHSTAGSTARMTPLYCSPLFLSGAPVIARMAASQSPGIPVRRKRRRQTSGWRDCEAVVTRPTHGGMLNQVQYRPTRRCAD